MNNHAPLVLSDVESWEWPVKTEKQGGHHYHWAQGTTALGAILDQFCVIIRPI